MHLGNFQFNLDKSIQVLADDDGLLKAIYYQDSTMKQKFEYFPELVLVDATYKLNDLRMPVFLQLVIDGNGESEIVVVFVVGSEDGETISSLVTMFKQQNPAWDKTRTILTDKDFMERSVYSEQFPNASLQLCLFHVLKSMRREIHCEKMNIRLEQKNVCLEILQKMAYSNNEDEYTQNYELLQDTKIQPVIDYIDHSWHPIKEEWVVGLKHSVHYSNNTTNRLESINQKLKQVISKFSNLNNFFQDLELVIHSLRQERDSRLSMALVKRTVVPFPPGSPEVKFSQFLTPHAFQIVLKQIELSSKVVISEECCDHDVVTLQTSSGVTHVTSTSCTCQFSAMNQLPCRHIFALRAKQDQPIYFEDAVSNRWRLDYYRHHASLAQDIDTNYQTATVYVQPQQAIMTQSQKYKKAFVEAQKLATLASEVSTVRFTERLKVLRQLTKLWESGQQAAVISTEFDIVDEDADCDVSDTTTEQATNTTSDPEVETNVIEEIQSVEVYM